MWFPTKNVTKKSDKAGCSAIWFTNSLEQDKGYSCVPQLPQNFIPGRFSVPQEGHLTAEREAPQLPQNFIPAGISALQWGQTVVAASGFPQAPQNFIPALLPAPQWGQAGVLAGGA